MVRLSEEVKEFQANARKAEALKNKIERKQKAIKKHEDDIAELHRARSQCFVDMRRLQPDLFEGVE